VVVGATGLVGREMLRILLGSGVPISNICAAASSKSAGTRISLDGESIDVFDANHIDFGGFDIAFFSAGSKVSEALVPIAAARGCLVVDNTSHFRMHDDVPLVIPEVNFNDIHNYPKQNIIANPNCSTIQMVMPLKPLHDLFTLKEVVVSTYQSVSGAGQKGVSELMRQITDINNDQVPIIEHFKKQIAYNIIPQIDDFTESKYTNEEFKMMNETKKILKLVDVDITATCVRVPVIVGHAVSVFAKFKRDVNTNEALQAIKSFPGIKVIDDDDYSTQMDAAGQDEVFVSRIRRHPNLKNGLSFWCVADNLRKGAALNAIQIAQRMSNRSI
jgi:aspartate-semialdehyde dehydrogenase